MFIKTAATYETSWDALKAAAADGSIREMLHSGDKIPVTLKTGEEITLDVTYDENGNLFFVLHDCMDDEHAMNKQRTNEGGWAACEMRKYLNKTVFALLPDELQTVIKPTTITQVIDGETVTCEDKLFLLSKTQVFGKGTWSGNEPDDTRLDIFNRERDRVKECGSNGTWFWWLRSPLSSSSSSFCLVHHVGISNSTGANYSYGVAFGFSI